jgi:hypothetical protein
VFIAEPAGALSCIPPEPIDWEDRYPRLDAALIIEIDAVEAITDGNFAGSLEISATVREILKGQAEEKLEYTVPSLNPWGPYYEPGDEVAVVVEDGVVFDGRQNICGPWFEPGELRQAAEWYAISIPSRHRARYLRSRCSRVKGHRPRSRSNRRFSNRSTETPLCRCCGQSS